MIVRAKRIAMHEQHALPKDFRYRSIFEKAAPSGLAKALAKQKVAIAMHYKARYAGSGEIAQSRLNAALVQIGIVVAYPGFEKVA
jgi:hypothetical protein